MNKRFKHTLILGLFALIVGSAVFALPEISFAQDVGAGLETVGETAGLQDTDPKIIIARIIRTVLGFLGIIATIIVLYGGFVWMTAGGDATKVEKAKKILLNGGIGLVIILFSWSITTFVLTAIMNATGSSTSGSSYSSGGGGFGGFGGGGTASFVATKFRPEGEVPIRNVQVQITFSRNINPETVEENVQITSDLDGSVVEGDILIEGNKITFIPVEACPEPNQDRACFAANTAFNVTLSSEIESAQSQVLNCALGSCTSSFTTGEIVDTEDPTANLSYPDDNARLEPFTWTSVQVEATDDFQVALADFAAESIVFDSVPAEGDDLSNVTISTDWDNSEYADGQSYTLTATVVDIAGNTDSDSINVRINPAHCYNGSLDADLGETGVDCGGDCGACSGGSCTTTADCSSGICSGGICASAPRIDAVEPLTGAPGTFVSIEGVGFGRSGTVSFRSDAGLIEAPIANCARGWSSTELIVEVPEGAVDGPITVTTAGVSDSTDNDYGPLIDDFDVTGELGLNLCYLSPNFGPSGTTVVATGSGFGDEQGTSQIFFEADEVRSITSWADDSIRFSVPTLEAGIADVRIMKESGVVSNPINFTVTEDQPDASATPTISFATPSFGPVGQYITIVGTNFGSSIGSVWFENTSSGYIALGSADFPDACSTRFWSDDEITIIVPSSYTNGEDVSAVVHNLFITTQAGTESSSVQFSVTSGDPSPGICAIDPESAAVGAMVTVYGSGFSSEAEPVFYNEAAAFLSDSSASEIEVEVPASASTGPFVVREGSEESNSVNFEISSASTAIEDSEVSAAYVWGFSTGIIPIAPELIEECSVDTASAVPNDRFTDDICLNAAVYAEFTMPMDEMSFVQGEEGSFRVEKCLDEDCDSVSQVTGTLTMRSENTAILWSPASMYDADSQYRVVVTDEVLSEDGIPMQEDESWIFSTGTSTTTCEVEIVRVSPTEKTVTALGDTAEFSALPGTLDCIVLDSDDYLFEWSINESYASTGDCDEATSSCMQATALAEGEAEVEVTELDSGVTGDALFIIDFSDPYVANYWPNCTTACVNADVGASFNTPMDSTIEDAYMTALYECENELCVNLGPSHIVASSSSCVLDEEGECTQIAFSTTSLDANTYYKAVVSGDVESTSGVSLIRANDGSDFSWIFRTKETTEACALERIAITPELAEYEAIGEMQSFSLQAYGSPDECSVAGQRLTATDYDWIWEDPIIDDSDVAEWFTIGGTLLDSNPSSISDGCTSSCIASGSVQYTALCGNGVIETGEDCDDGNAASGDGCSIDCLNEGGGPTCGDGTLDAGEECDDGNSQNSDGCSDQCLNEGARAAGATCGNSSIGYAANLGGEECDDGNRSSGDGCSSECLHEGSVSIADVDAICGNSIIDTPYETCDDGNITDGDGCSSSCLKEGGYLGSVCGDGFLDFNLITKAGEECDDGNVENGDGCSDDCLLEGSSLDYEEPSICGDGAVGYGEDILCEVSSSGDGDLDPYQVAEILDSAVEKVDPDTGIAVSTIRVEDADYGISTEAEINLACVAEAASDCPDEEVYGVTVGGCCVPRPEVTLYPNGSNVCRNAAIYAIFDSEMDTDSLEESAYIQLDPSLGICPEGYEEYDGTTVTWLQNIWHQFVGLFLGSANAKTIGDCILPIASITQTQTDDGDYKVTFRTNALLYPSALHTIYVEGEDVFGEGGGALTKLGVGMTDTESQDFTTISDRCTLDSIEITDSSEADGVFTEYNESHDFLATTYSFTTGSKQEIAPVTGVYEWEWEDWQLSNEDDLTLVSFADDESEVSAVATGEGTLAVEAVVTVDSDGDDEGTDDSDPKSVSDGMNLSVFICDNPWPEYDAFPFIDDATGTVDGTTEGVAWMNFSTYYCRDNDQPTVTVVAPPDIETEDVIKEYLFKVDDGSGDAIGFRLATNENYYSPMTWYQAAGFSGSPAESQLDEFEAVRDGRTVYIAAPNVDEDAGEIYSNMYIFSYNEGASETTVNIFNQMMENLDIATNIESTAFCYDAGSLTEETCSSDLDCTGSAVCADEKAKLARDMERLTDIVDISTTLYSYGLSNRVCSATTSQSCTIDSSCPGTETCEATYPTLPSGTYVRALAASGWSSWLNDVSSTIGTTLPSDPLNDFDGCGVNPYSGYAEDTCVNQDAGEYLCPVGSYSYHYRSLGPFTFELGAELEYEDADWIYDLDEYDDFDILIGGNSSSSVSGFTGSTAFCDGSTVYGSSNTCGDGIVGSSEVCEPGQLGSAASCDSDGDGVDDGTIAQVCASDCSAWEDDPAGECTAYECGNGVIEDTEQCDDGSFNGRYGYCGYDCTYSSSFWCGDGSLGGGEVCDCGSTSLGGRTYGGGLCSTAGNLNGVYAFNPANTCSWDCAGPASYCGDGIVDSAEECDGDQETYSGKLCSYGVSSDSTCESDSDCTTFGFGGVSAGTGTCGTSTRGTKYDECPTTTICLAGSDALLGYECNIDSDCDSSSGGDGVCSTDTFETTRVRDCSDNGASGETCTWEGDWEDIACRGTVLCGNGTVDDGEECDDGNDDSTDSCTAQCKVNICGDGYLNAGIEECDEGDENGEICSSSYGTTCTYCSETCDVISASGSYCGDGTLNGDEFCDAGDLQYYYVSDSSSTTSGVVYSSCAVGSDTLEFDEDGDGTADTFYDCIDIGVCDGGTDQGEICSSDASSYGLASCSGGGECVYPTCASDCETSCPFTYENDDLLMTSSGLAGKRSSIDLESFADASALSGIRTASNSATMYFPSCSTAQSVTADVSFADLDYPTNYIVFVTDLSGSMGYPLTSTETRLEVTQDVINDAATTLYDELDGYVELTAFGYEGGYVYFPDETTSSKITSTAPLTSSDVESHLEWFGDSDSASFISLIGNYSSGGGTNTYDGLEAAKYALDTITDTNVRKIIVLMTDGAYSGTDPETIACDIKADEIELYTVTLASGSESEMQPDEDVCTALIIPTAPAGTAPDCSNGAASLTSVIDQMACYSSGNAHELTGIDYAFSGSSASDLEEMYESILDSILGATFSFVVNGDLISDTIQEGNNVDLPWPEGFACDDDTQEIPIRLYFDGEGTIGISNVNFEYCP